MKRREAHPGRSQSGAKVGAGPMSAVPAPLEFRFEVPGTPSVEQARGDSEDDALALAVKYKAEQKKLLWLPAVITEKLWTLALQGLELSTSDRILDVGSGLAYHLEAMLNGLRPQTWLLDASAKSLKAAEESYPGVHIMRRDWYATRLPDASFRVITGFNADSVIPNPDKLRDFLREMVRLLQPGGRMVLLNIYYFPDDYMWGGFKPQHIPELDAVKRIQAAELGVTRFLAEEGNILAGMGLNPQTHSAMKGTYPVYGMYLAKPVT